MNPKPPGSGDGGKKNPFYNSGSRSTSQKASEKPATAPAAKPSAKNPFEQNRYKAAASVTETSSGEVMGHGAARDDYTKRVSEALKKAEEKPPEPEAPQPFKMPDKLSNKDYRHVFAQKYAAEEAIEAAKKKEHTEKTKKAADDIAAKAQQQKNEEEKRRADNYRARARELQNQINFWKQQLQQDPSAAERINGNIQALTYELGAIPSMYWN